MELYSLWCLGQKCLERSMSNVGGRLFGVMMHGNSLMECCLGKVTGAIEGLL